MTSGLFNLANYTFNPYAIPTLVTGMAIISLGFFVLVGERNSRVSLGFFVMTFTAATWLFSYSICIAQRMNRLQPAGRRWGTWVSLSFPPLPKRVPMAGGLGLHIVKIFSEILGGTVTVTSQPANGSTFAVTRPCV